MKSKKENKASLKREANFVNRRKRKKEEERMGVYVGWKECKDRKSNTRGVQEQPREAFQMCWKLPRKQEGLWRREGED
jgi:hypothetical protein